MRSKTEEKSYIFAFMFIIPHLIRFIWQKNGGFVVY